MSKKWTPELDAIVSPISSTAILTDALRLLQGVFEECNISFGKALCEKLAQHVRAAGVDGFTECTPKSIENRLYSWKKKKKNTTAGSGDTPASTPKKAAAKPKKEPAAPKAKTPRAKKGAVKKEASEEADGVLTPSPGRKRSAESEKVGDKKKLKLEQDVDDEDGAGEAEDEV